MTPLPSMPRDVGARWRAGVVGWAWPGAVALLVAASYIVFAGWQWQRFVVKSWDLGIFTQMFAGYATNGIPIVNIKGDGYHLLGDHFHPLLAALTPVFAVAPHAFTLLVIQALCFAVAAAIITRGAQRVLAPARHATAASIVIGLAFGLSWGLQHAADAQFHEIALAVPILSGSLVAVVEWRWIAAAVWAAPLVFVKEDLGFTVLMIGVVIVLSAALDSAPERAQGRQRGLIAGAAVAVWGVVGFAVATLVVLPSLNPAGGWAYGGNTDIVGVLSDPASAFHPDKFVTLGLLIAAGAGLVLRSPIALVALPTLAWRFLSPNEGYWGPDWHYSAVLMPVVFAGLLDGIVRCRSARPRWLGRYAEAAPWVAGAVATLMLPFLPLWSMLEPASWEPSERTDHAAAMVAEIPAGASVESDIGLMSYLVDDHDVHWIGNQNPPRDCLVIDRAGGGTPGEWGDVLQVAAVLHPGTPYALVAVNGDYELACQPGVAP